MTELLVVIVTALVLIAAAALAGPRLRVAAPLVLVVIGVAVSFLPAAEAIHVEPGWIIEGILPALLYSSAVSMPAMNFRREFGAISVLSVLLVVGTSLLLGVFFMLVLPGLGFAWGVALGAIVSPTDAVATSIVRREPVPRRVVAMLDGESLLNDATALVLLRTAIVATAASFSFWGALGTFAYSVVVAVVVGAVVGRLNLAVRRRVGDPTVNTVLSFTVPFVASVPVTALHGSGLVAAVVAGLVTGIRGPRELSPTNRMSDSTNWRTVELVLEGVVFLTMGLEIRSIVDGVQQDRGGIGLAVLVAVGALVLTVLVRAAYVAPLLGVLAARARQNAKLRPRIHDMQERMTTPEGKQRTLEEMNARGWGRRSMRDLDRFAVRLTRGLATIEYFLRHPLGWREGTAVVWAGMRGAITVAAAQTLPERTPFRSELVLVAFAVAALSLLVQGGTVGPLVRALAPAPDPAAGEPDSGERTRILELLRAAADAVPAPPHDGEPTPRDVTEQLAYRVAVLTAQRTVLLDARDDGAVDADLLAEELANLDASQVAMEMRGRAVS